jgi:hypothetical protein
MKPWSDKQCRTFYHVLGLGGIWLGLFMTFASMVMTALRIDVSIYFMLYGLIVFVFGCVQAGAAGIQLQINELRRHIEALEAGRFSETQAPS